MRKKGLTYKDAGVDIDAGAEAVEAIRQAVERTHGPNVLAGIGGFSGAYRCGSIVIVQSMDGVGTLIKVAIDADNCAAAGIALVHHCANDVRVSGASPCTFLDYFASSKLDHHQMVQAVTGAASACEELGIAFMGGETAEMPDFYLPGIFDLVGCMTGVAHEDSIITGTNIEPGDLIIGWESDGPHTNGYSLIRKCVEIVGLNIHDPSPWYPSATVAEELLRGHRCYVPLLDSLDALYRNALYPSVLGVAHITGGGIPGNLKRILPEGCLAIVDTKSWPRPRIFDWLQTTSGNDDTEMHRIFNMGIGLITVITHNAYLAIKSEIIPDPSMPKPYVIGKIVAGDRGVEMIY